jgi:hypothetical protein
MICVVSSKSSSFDLAGCPPAPVFTGSAVLVIAADREENPDGEKADADERRAASDNVIESFIVERVVLFRNSMAMAVGVWIWIGYG